MAKNSVEFRSDRCTLGGIAAAPRRFATSKAPKMPKITADAPALLMSGRMTIDAMPPATPATTQMIA